MSRRSKKKRRNRVRFPAGGPYHKDDGKPSPSTDPRPGGRLGPGGKQVEQGAQPTAPASRGLHLVDSPDQQPKLVERLVAVFAPANGDRSDTPIEMVRESLARKLIADRIGTFVRISKHLSGVRLFPEPPRSAVRHVSIRGASFDAIIDHDTIDNPVNVFSYANKPVYEHYIDGNGRRKRRRVPATTREYKTFPDWVRDHVFRRVLLDCIKPAA